MSKILVNDLKELAKQTDSTKIIDFKGYPIQIKTYLPITEKIGLVSSIYKSAVDEDDNLQNISYNSLNIAYKVLVTKAYTDINLPKDTVQAYDLLVQTGLYDEIYQSIPVEERIELENVFDNFVDEKQERYKRENTLPNIIKNILNELVGKIPTADEAKKFVEEASKAIEGFDKDKLEFLKDFQLWNNGAEK